jgi:hypothetical protein
MPWTAETHTASYVAILVRRIKTDLLNRKKDYFKILNSIVIDIVMEPYRKI